MTRWGPDAKAAAVSITFDNLGEAMDLAIGAWPEHEPVGHHYSVRQVLPTVLATLDDLGVRCTYFAEGWSADVYPDALHDLAAAGHEIGYHGWRHEHWPRIDSRELEAELILRGTRKMAKHGITVRGFRPPRRAGSGPGCADRDRPVHLLLVPVLSVRQRDLARLRRSSVRIAGRWVLA